METTKIESTNSHIKILKSLNDFLAEIWESDRSRPWDIYSKEKFGRFWDVRYYVEARSR